MTGLPEITEEEKNKKKCPATVGTSISMIVKQAFGVGIAWLIYFFGSTDEYNGTIKWWNERFNTSYKWAFLTVPIYASLVIWLNLYPVRYKEIVMRGGNMRANQFLYRPVVGGDDAVSAVTLYEEGDKGRYNRANRSLYHFLENGLTVFTCLPGALLIFPFPTFVWVCIYALGRILHQLGYTLIGFGAHAPGFALDRLAMMTLIGFHWLTFIMMVAN